MSAALSPYAAAIAALVVLSLVHATEEQTTEIIIGRDVEGDGGGYFVVLFKLSANEQPLLSLQDAGVIMGEVKLEERRANGAHFNLSECLRRRREWGVESCWLTTPCLNLNLLATKDYEDQNDVISNYTGDCSLLVHWLRDMQVAKETSNKNGKPSPGEVWGYGILTTAIISLSGISGILCYPIMKKGYFKEVMNVLMGLAFGSLSATAIFQLIPETFKIKEHDEEYLLKALICWGSMWLFYLIGVITNIVTQYKKQFQNSGSNRHQSNKPPLSSQSIKNGLEMKANPSTPTIQEEVTKKFISRLDDMETNIAEVEECPQVPTKLATAGMVMFGDSLHNFVDGMSIGAGYSHSLITGFSISAGVACEEFPHELGDFAVLIKSGYPFKKALKLNYASASTIFLGLIVGILLGQVEASIYIYAFSGGLFLYIALAELIPELKEMVKDMQVNGIKPAIIAFSLQNIGMLSGALVLYLVAKYIDNA